VIEALANNPYPPKSKELRDLPGRYRLRIDSWRIIYRVDNQELTILILRVRRKEGSETYQDIE
jgi:mRNA interferase RelE/StbE